jgi:hypothetical protein
MLAEHLDRIAEAYAAMDERGAIKSLVRVGTVWKGAGMNGWTSDELDKIETADELEIAPLRRDGTLRNPTTIWVVRLGDDLYVRSVNGRTSAWFRGTQVRYQGHVQAGGVDKDVSFVDADPDVEDEIDGAYRTNTADTPRTSSDRY